MLLRTSSKNRLVQGKFKETTLKEAISRALLNYTNTAKVIMKQEISQTKESVSDQNEIQQLKLLQMVHAYQLKNNSGYFGYQSWLSLNFELWGERVKTASQKLWKIMRLINHGQVYIPTGLVFQITNFFMKKGGSEGLRVILQQFLMKNGINGGIGQFREIKNYGSLCQIVEMYMIQEEQQNQRSNVRSEGFNASEFQTRMMRQQRLKNQELMNIRYHILASQIEKCTFKPEISQYSSHLKGKSRKNCSELYCSKKQQRFNVNFQATKINPKIYVTEVLDIPGVQSHIQRQEYSYAQRGRVGRFLGDRLFNLK